MDKDKDINKISIIIPTVNRNSLSSVLEALNNQTRKPDEIIIMEDNDLLGQAIMRNRGFEKSKGDLIVFLDDDTGTPDDVEIIPEGMYVCLYCDGYNREEEGLVKLMDYIFTHDYKVVGDCISEILVELPTTQNFDRNAFFKLQVMIKR